MAAYLNPCFPGLPLLFQGKTNPAFSKPCFCLSDTRHFRHFVAFGGLTLRLLNALNSEDRGVKVRFSLATIAFDRELAQMSQILSSQGKNAPSDPYPHYLVRLAASSEERSPCFQGVECKSVILRERIRHIRKNHINFLKTP